MESVTLTAPAISCGHCQHTVETAVGALPGVEGIQVVVPTKQATVLFDPERLTRERIEIALAAVGYPAQAGAAIPTPARGKPLRNVHGEAIPSNR